LIIFIDSTAQTQWDEIKNINSRRIIKEDTYNTYIGLHTCIEYARWQQYSIYNTTIKYSTKYNAKRVRQFKIHNKI